MVLGVCNLVVSGASTRVTPAWKAIWVRNLQLATCNLQPATCNLQPANNFQTFNNTWTCRGPWTPLVSVSSMSAVLLGPLINVIASGGPPFE